MSNYYSGMAESLASQGRYGDTTLIHVNPIEVEGLGRLIGKPLPRNPVTGLPEGFWFLAPIIAALASGLGGVGGAVTSVLSPILGSTLGSAVGGAVGAVPGALGSGLGSLAGGMSGALPGFLGGAGGFGGIGGTGTGLLGSATTAMGGVPTMSIPGLGANLGAGGLGGLAQSASPSIAVQIPGLAGSQPIESAAGAAEGIAEVPGALGDLGVTGELGETVAMEALPEISAGQMAPLTGAEQPSLLSQLGPTEVLLGGYGLSQLLPGDTAGGGEPEWGGGESSYEGPASWTGRQYAGPPGDYSFPDEEFDYYV